MKQNFYIVLSVSNPADSRPVAVKSKYAHARGMADKGNEIGSITIDYCSYYAPFIVVPTEMVTSMPQEVLEYEAKLLADGVAKKDL
jgi:hypothetical protein